MVNENPMDSKKPKTDVEALNELKQTNLQIWQDHEASFRKIFYAICVIGGLVVLLLFLLLVKG